MAIILEQQKKPMREGMLISLLVVALIIGLITYFVFFAKRQGTLPPTVQGDATGGITKINVDEFGTVSSNKPFTDLKQYPLIDIATVRTHLGKVNPFQ